MILICLILYHLFHRISKISAWKKLPKCDFTAISKIHHTKGDTDEANWQENDIQEKTVKKHNIHRITWASAWKLKIQLKEIDVIVLCACAVIIILL